MAAASEHTFLRAAGSSFQLSFGCAVCYWNVRGFPREEAQNIFRNIFSIGRSRNDTYVF